MFMFCKTIVGAQWEKNLFKKVPPVFLWAWSHRWTRSTCERREGEWLHVSSPVEHLAHGLITRPSLRSCSFITPTELIYGLLQRNMYLHDSHQGADSVEHTHTERPTVTRQLARETRHRQTVDDGPRESSQLGSTFTTWQCGSSGKVRGKKSKTK